MKKVGEKKLFAKSQNASFLFIGRMYILTRITCYKFHDFWIFINWDHINWNLTSKFCFFNFSLYKLKKKIQNNIKQLYVSETYFFFQFMEWKIKKTKFWGQISINMISINKNPKIMKLITCNSSQDVHSSYKKKWDILTLCKKKIFTYFFHSNKNRSKFSLF